jgi:3'-phosphoadenosine 5'-phosphosulfate sulfotransferase (PAPS reductase)/FAD synthetase
MNALNIDHRQMPLFPPRVRVVVPVSGGKDSQATLKLAAQTYPACEIRGLFCDTGFEHPWTYAHVEKMRKMYGDIRIDTISAGTVEEQCLKHGRFPGGGARFCTEELKIRPTKVYCRELAIEQGSRLRSVKRKITGSLDGGFEVWYGMRSDESTEREKRYMGKVCDEVYPPHEVMNKYPQYLAALGVSFRLAVLDWTERDIFDFLDGEECPLYAEGFDRVGCFPCGAAGDKVKEKAFQFDDFGRQQYAKVIRIGAAIGKSIWTSKGGKARNEGAGCAVCSI